MYGAMPRTARLATPGLLHHVMIRGIEPRKIFTDDVDREDFIERLSDLLPETGTQCYAWSFLSNHAHFLFRSGSQGIAALMRRLLTGYAIFFNPAGSGIPKQIQIGHMPGGPIVTGIGEVYTPEPVEGQDRIRFGGTGPVFLLRAQRPDRVHRGTSMLLCFTLGIRYDRE